MGVIEMGPWSKAQENSSPVTKVDTVPVKPKLEPPFYPLDLAASSKALESNTMVDISRVVAHADI